MHVSPRIVSLLIGTSFAAMAAPATAQTVQGDSTDPNVIIVTAQNRAENVQDVPIAIDVVNAEAIKDAGVTDFRDLTRIAPVLNITQDANYTRVAMRGVGTNSNDEAQDQSIAVNIDGEYINRPNVLNLALFDIDRIEVLRGPQGTLYGRNATGGAINFIARKPGNDFGANVDVTYGNYDHKRIEAGIDVPLGTIAAIRVAGLYNKRDGYYYHPNRAAAGLSDVSSGTADNQGVRGTLSLTPGDRLRVDLTGEYVRNRGIVGAFDSYNFNAPGQGPDVNCNGNGFVDAAPLIPGGQCIPLYTQVPEREDRSVYDGPISRIPLNPNKQDSYAVRGRIGYDFGPAMLTYIGGYRHTKQDTDLALPSYTFYEFGNKVDTQSHELRLNGTSGPITWQGGVFYYNEKLKNLRGLFSPFIGPNGGFINTFARDTDSKSHAAFAQVDFALSDQLTVVGGIRYTKDKRRGIYGNYGGRPNSGPVAPTTPPPSVLNLAQSDSNVSWLLGVNYKPSEDSLLYAKVATGYKAGGFDSVDAYDPETNTAYEVGSKLNFGPNAEHLLNAAAFYYDYKDLQTAILLNPAIGAEIFNAGKAVIKGFEVEGTFRLSDNDTFSASFNYLDTEYKELLASYAILDTVNGGNNGLPDLDPGPAVVRPNLAGNVIPQSPKITITAGYDHVFDFAGGNLTASVYTRFKSRYFTDVFNYPSSEQDAYTQTDLSLKFEPSSGVWNVQAFVRNLEDTMPMTFGNFVSAGPRDDVYDRAYGAPRTYGVRVGVDF